MRIRYFNRIPFQEHHTLPLIMEAALRMLREHGRPTFDAQGPSLVAKVDGYTFRYYAMTPVADAIPELPPMLASGETRWPSSAHCIDVEASELLFGLVMNADGLFHRRVVRGPWEYEIARAAGLEKQFYYGLPLPPCFPESRCSRNWPITALRPMRKRRLRMPVRFSVAGYTKCIHRLVPSGSDFDQIVTTVAECYRKSRSYDDDYRSLDTEDTSSFGIWGWAGDRPVRIGKRMKKPDIAFWISPTGGCEAAAALLLLLDKEHTAKRPSAPITARTAGSPAALHSSAA